MLLCISFVALNLLELASMLVLRYHTGPMKDRVESFDPFRVCGGKSKDEEEDEEEDKQSVNEVERQLESRLRQYDLRALAVFSASYGLAMSVYWMYFIVD